MNLMNIILYFKSNLYLVFGVCISFVSHTYQDPVKYEAVNYCIGK